MRLVKLLYTLFSLTIFCSAFAQSDPEFDSSSDVAMNTSSHVDKNEDEKKNSVYNSRIKFQTDFSWLQDQGKVMTHILQTSI